MSNSIDPQMPGDPPETAFSSPPLPEVVIEARDLCKTYRIGRTRLEVLREVDISVREGEFVALYGHSGSGKSTLLHLLGLLDKPSSGTILFNGQDISQTSGRRRNRIRNFEIGFIFQFYHLLPELSVLENTVLPAMIGHSLPAWWANKRRLKSRAKELLTELGLSDRLRHRPKQLSGGERQRVAIARSLLHGPQLLLADEPTGNLDSATGERIIDVLKRFNRDHGQTILMVTHDDDLASEVGRSIFLKDGQIVAPDAIGPSAKLITAHGQI